MSRKNQGFPLQLTEWRNQKQSSAYLDDLRLAACSATKPASSPMAAVSWPVRLSQWRPKRASIWNWLIRSPLGTVATCSSLAAWSFELPVSLVVNSAIFPINVLVDHKYVSAAFTTYESKNSSNRHFHGVSGANKCLLCVTYFNPWASECLDVKNYKWRLNPVWHRMQYQYGNSGRQRGNNRTIGPRISSKTISALRIRVSVSFFRQ